MGTWVSVSRWIRSRVSNISILGKIEDRFDSGR